ncbi:hypothetical protein [Massilia sp. METH4]|uniref:hypothetical protein n=1 Tax=Massilia sp. METH4 TaxID=3123041 RepID=UPI0030D04A90
MTREKDQLTNTEDAGYFTQSGNHAAGGPANDTTQVNRAPNINEAASKQSSAAGSSGGMDMTQQSIGGQGAQDGISGTPSGTQGGQSGQGINQGGQNQQSSQGQSDYMGGSPGNQGGIRNDPRTQADPLAPNHDRYGSQQTGATSGEVGDGRSPHQVAHGGSQASQHSAGGSLQQDGERAARQDYGSSQETTAPGGTGTLADHLQSGPGNKYGDASRQGGPGNSGLSQMNQQQGGESMGEAGQSGLQGNQQSDKHGAGSDRTTGAGARQDRGDDGSAPGAGTAQRGAGGSQNVGNQQSSSPGGSGGMADKLQGGPGNEQSSNNKGGPGQTGLARMKEQQQQGGPGGQSQQMEQSTEKPRAGTGHGHGGQHSGGMGGERGGSLHDVGAQSGQTGRGGLGGNNANMQESSQGNQQSGDNLIGQTTLGSGGSQSADRDSLDTLPADAMGGERVGMGSRGNSQQSDKAGNAQADTWKNQARPNNRSDNEQADRQLGMQGSPGEPGHDIDDIGSKQSGGSGGKQGGSEDQR